MHEKIYFLQNVSLKLTSKLAFLPKKCSRIKNSREKIILIQFLIGADYARTILTRNTENSLIKSGKN